MDPKIVILKPKENRIFEYAKQYHQEYLEFGAEVANNWLAINCPRQLVRQVKRMGWALERKRRSVRDDLT